VTTQAIPVRNRRPSAVFPVLWAASFCHLLNDMLQSLLPAVYPILQGGFDLSFAQVGLLTFVYQLTASLFQPFIGYYTDRRPLPYSLPFGMAASMAGLLTLAFAASASRPTAVLTGPHHRIGDWYGPAEPDPTGGINMVRAHVEEFSLTAEAGLAWSGNLPRRLQQVLFDTAGGADSA